MPQKSKLGLPLLTEQTYLEYRRQTSEMKGYEEAFPFFQRLMSMIRETDPLYAKFIDDAAAMYPVADRRVAWAELIGSYELLRKEGPLPRLNREKFEEQWRATMSRNEVIVALNVGANMDLILDDNPVYWQFIMDSTGYFPAEQRMNVMSDLSCGYMFLLHSAEH